uniref:7TM_GPCR_Srx domain-containing protein n=1 Tax=Panagrellus redivivus TaxID=6233 RepID=A0A7E4V7I8_PANRE
MTSLLDDGVDDTTMNTIIIYLLCTRKDQFSAPVYSQLLHMCINDGMQLFVHIIGGYCILSQTDMPFLMNKILGGVINSGWFGWIAFSFTLSLNRFLTFCFPKYYDAFFSNRHVHWQIAICWAITLFTFAIYMTPFCTVQFYRLSFEWQYDKSTPWHSIVNTSELYYATVLMGLSLLNYAFIVIRMKSMKRTTSEGQQGSQEIRVCIQAVCLCLYTAFVQVHWQFDDYYMPNSRYTPLSTSFTWIFNCGMNPILCLTVNLSIKNAFLELLHIKKTSTCQVVTILPISND